MNIQNVSVDSETKNKEVTNKEENEMLGKDVVKKVVVLLLSVLMLSAVAGCSTRSSKAFTFTVETGDNIKVKLDTSEGYDITSDVPFSITCEDEAVSDGMFVFGEMYEQYAAVVEEDELATLLDSGEKDGNEYIFWSYDDREYNYAVLVEDSNTSVIISNLVSEESARECFERLTITKEN